MVIQAFFFVNFKSCLCLIKKKVYNILKNKINKKSINLFSLIYLIVITAYNITELRTKKDNYVQKKIKKYDLKQNYFIKYIGKIIK